MQPSDKRAKLQRASLSRGRMLLKAYLNFLPGYPMAEQLENGIAWHRHDGEDIVLTSETIRLAVYGWNELDGKFPNVFPKMVADTDAWQRVVPKILEQLGKAVYGKITVPASLWSANLGISRTDRDRAVALEHSIPALRPLLNAVSWQLVLQPDQIRPVLNWFEAEQIRLVQILENFPGINGIDLVLLLYQFVEKDGTERWEKILETLGTPEARTIPTHCSYFRKMWNRHLTGIAQQTRSKKPFGGKPVDSPAADWADKVFAFVQNITIKSSRDRRQALDLFNELVPPDLLNRWRLWWKDAAPVIRSAVRVFDRAKSAIEEDNTKRARQAHKIVQQLGQLYHHAPPEWVFQLGILDIIHNWNDSFWKPFQHSAQTLLRSVDVEWHQTAPRAKILDVLYERLRYFSGINEKFDYPLVLKEISRWKIPQNFYPSLIDVYRWSNFYSENREKLRLLGRMLEFWFTSNVCRKDNFWNVIVLCRILDDEERIKSILKILGETDYLKGRYVCDNDLYAAAVLSGDDKEFRTFYKILDSFCDDGRCADIKFLTEFLSPTPWKAMLHDAILNNETSLLFEAVEQINMLHQRKIKIPLPEYDESVSTAWMPNYPGTVQNSLRQLSCLTPKAEQIAARKLSQLRFDPNELAEEIKLLRNRLADQPDNLRIERRLENLQRRIEMGKPKQVSEIRLQKLDAKIQEQVRRYFFEQLNKTTLQLFEEFACSELKIAVYPQPWRESLAYKIVYGILNLDTPNVKNLGMKLLRSVCGENPWDFHHEPANTAFLKKLCEQGINMEPWLILSEPVHYIMSTGETLTVSFETDPFEVLKMGAPFKTCLSPCDFNFFSTIANALDINKRVLYGKSSDGIIVTRCLIALTDSGELLAFRPYAHDPFANDPAWPFKKVVADVLEKLAKRMNTIVMKSGTVSRLVSPEWYDDGSIILNEHLKFLNDNSVFRKKLQTLPPEELLDAIQSELDPLPIRPFIVAPFLQLPEVAERPELVRPLLPYLPPSLSFDDTVQLVKLIDKSGDKSEAELLSQRYLLRRLNLLFRYNHYSWEDSAVELAPIVPQMVLEHLRQTKLRGTQKIDDHRLEIRRKLLVTVYETLGKKKKAKQLGRQIDSDTSKYEYGNVEEIPGW